MEVLYIAVGQRVADPYPISTPAEKEKRGLAGYLWLINRYLFLVPFDIIQISIQKTHNPRTCLDPFLDESTMEFHQKTSSPTTPAVYLQNPPAVVAVVSYLCGLGTRLGVLMSGRIASTAALKYCTLVLAQ